MEKADSLAKIEKSSDTTDSLKAIGPECKDMQCVELEKPTGASDQSKAFSPIDVILDFKILDENHDGEITAVEFIDSLRSHPDLALKFGLSADILNENGTREKYDLKFGSIDYNHSKTVNVSLTTSCIWKLLEHFGHGDLPASHLAGLLSECGYKGDQLRAILDKASEHRRNPHDLKKHNSLIVRMTAQALEKSPSLRRIAPESTSGICCWSAVTVLCFGGFVASMVVGIIGAIWASTTWQGFVHVLQLPHSDAMFAVHFMLDMHGFKHAALGDATAEAMGWNASRCIILRRGCKCTCCESGTLLMGPKCERIGNGQLNRRQNEGSETPLLVPRRKGPSGPKSGYSGGSDSGCSETITAFVLLQYRLLNGSGWSKALPTQVFMGDFQSVAVNVNLFDQSSMIKCWFEPSNPDNVAINYVLSEIKEFEQWRSAFIAMAVLGGLPALAFAMAFCAAVWTGFFSQEAGSAEKAV